jgi:hypothetical protein
MVYLLLPFGFYRVVFVVGLRLTCIKGGSGLLVFTFSFFPGLKRLTKKSIILFNHAPISLPFFKPCNRTPIPSVHRRCGLSCRPVLTEKSNTEVIRNVTSARYFSFTLPKNRRCSSRSGRYAAVAMTRAITEAEAPSAIETFTVDRQRPGRY